MNPGVRANFLPDRRFVKLRPALQEYLGEIARNITPHNFVSLCEDSVLPLIQDVFDRVSADEGSIWILDPEKENLVVSYNSGPNASEIVGFKQPLAKGIVSMVVASEQAVVENQVHKNAQHSALLDHRIGKLTHAMIVVPLYFLHRVRGVISCVQLLDIPKRGDKAEPVAQTKKPPGFSSKDLRLLQTASSLIRDLIDYRLLGTATGWNR